MADGNIFTGIPARLPQELFTLLLDNAAVRIERIVSRGHCSADGEWYDQDGDEWVLLLQGQAGIVYGRDGGLITLNPGDYLLIPAHVRHRVDWTAPDVDTVWLAVHFSSTVE